MKALYCHQGQLELMDAYPFPKRDAAEALIRVSLAGICATDLEIKKGYMDFRGVPGHEFVGVVEESNDTTWVGQRVVGEINCACGDCTFCRRGLRNHCPERSVLGILNRDGAFGEFLSLPTANLHPVPGSLSDEEAVFVEPLAAAYQVLEQVKIGEGDRVAVLGDGKLGLLVAQVLAEVTDRLFVIGRHPERAGIISRDAIRFVSVERCVERGFDLVVECTGSPEGLPLALGLLRPRGTLVLKSTVCDKGLLDFSPVVINEITLVGSRCGPFPKALEALVAKKVEVTSLIGEILPLVDGSSAFEKAGRPGSLKIILKNS
ncbi:MAG: alcohol dehydrogenase catalytic domain-containing protein [Candidatus Binatia bacterium]